jgi:hypothetical protein
MGLGDVEVGLLAVYAMQNQQLASSYQAAENQVASRQAEIKSQKELELAAEERQRQAAKGSGGFWSTFKKVASTVAKVATVVAGAAAVVASGGAALPLAVGIAGVALSAGGMAVRELSLLGKDSSKAGTWLELSGAAVGVGAATAAALGVMSLAAEGSDAMRTVGTAATATNAGGTVAAAAATVVIADYQRDAEHAAADVQAIRFAMERHHREIKMIIESCEDSTAATRDALQSTQKALESLSHAGDVAISGMKA